MAGLPPIVINQGSNIPLLNLEREQAQDLVKGAATAPLTFAPDLLGMITGGAVNATTGLANAVMNQVPPQVRAMGGLPASGNVVPAVPPIISGDPIRRTAGLDPESPFGMVGEFFDPTSAVAKAPKAAATVASTLLPAILRRGKEPLELSTRIPTSVKTPVNPFTRHLRPDVESMMEHPENAEKIFDTFRELPNVRKELQHASSDKLDRYLREHMADNLQFLYDQLPKEVADRAAKWYEGANRFSLKLADDFSIEPEQASGVIAVLSPQKDWYQNASLAERLMSVPQDMVGVTKQMRDKAKEIYPTGHLRIIYEAINKKPFAEMIPFEKALMARLYDEAHHGRGFRSLSPEGELGDFVRVKSGAPRKVAWGSTQEIAKAFQILEDGSKESISQALGQQHKVRSFFNNINAPFSTLGDVTGDTHQVAANLLRPLSGSSTEVAQALGAGPTSRMTGIQGTFPVHADAVREAAERTGRLPRETQSITWEAIRGMFSPEQKRDKRLLAEARRVWENFRAGHISAGEARDEINRIAGGVNLPDWARSGAGGDTKIPTSTFERDVSDAVLPRRGRSR